MAAAGVNAEGGDRQTDAALREVLGHFRRKISDTNSQRFQEGSEMRLKIECFRIQRDQERLAALTNLRRIQQFLLRLKELQVVMKEFCDGEFFISHIWGAMQFLISTASSTLRDGSDGLLCAYEKMGRIIPELKGLEPLFQSNTGLRKCLVALYSDILDFHSGAYRCFTQFSEKGRKKIFKSAWDDFRDNDFSYLQSKMRRHRMIVEYGENCFRNQVPIDFGRLYDYENDRVKDEEEHVEKESKRRKERFKEAQQWISADGDTSLLTHTNLCDERKGFEGTCDWINDVDAISNWLNEPAPKHPVLWMNGSMGAGKSTLASYLVEKCREPTSTRASFECTYFYCKEGDPKSTSLLSICIGLLYRQLMRIETDEKFRHLISHCCDKKGNSGSTQSIAREAAESLLKTFFEIIPDQFIIIDGLDECEKPVIKEALRILTSVVMQQDTNEPGRLRLLVVSRDLGDIRKYLVAEAVHAKIFTIEAKLNAPAMKLYVDKRIAQFGLSFRLSDEEEREIIDKTFDAAKGAQGMFLFAKLTLNHLEDSVARSSLFRKLREDHFPTNIREAYDRLLESLKKSLTAGDDEEPWNKAKLIFGWLTCAERALHWHEIRAIASIERSNESVELQEHGFIHDVQKFCGTLVRVRRGNKVELIHHTARRYILESKHVDKQEVLFDLATLCMQYLTFPCFERGISESARKKFASKGDYAFQDYAVSKWFYHIATVVKIQELTIDETKSIIFAKALDDFTNRYEESFDDMDSPPSSASSESSQVNLEEVKEQARKECARLEGSPFYDLLLNLWIHVTKQEKEGDENRNKPCLRELEKVLMDNRKVIEELGEVKGPDRCQDLHDFYGKNLYKCPRTRCNTFHEGLKDDKQRKRHIGQHQRPFSCSVPECNLGEAGFANNKDLEKHKKNYHSELVEGHNPWPQRNRTSNEARKFDCRICQKSFTRKINLDGHTRSHFGDRPYSCQACDKKFTRLNDLRRHEKLHLRTR